MLDTAEGPKQTISPQVHTDLEGLISYMLSVVNAKSVFLGSFPPTSYNEKFQSYVKVERNLQ